MGNLTDSAPSYEELYHNHPVNQYTPSGSSTTASYAQVPQEDTLPDPELESGTALQDRGDPKAHVHCEICDRQKERADKRKADLNCCWIAVLTIVLVAFFLMAFGIVAIVTTR